MRLYKRALAVFNSLLIKILIMSDLFFEIYSEEIPSEIQDYSSRKIFNNVHQKLQKLFKKKFNGKYFFSPKRIGFYICEIPNLFQGNIREIRGPKVTATQQALEGFVRKYQLKEISELIHKGSYYFYHQKCASKCSKLIIKSVIEEIISNFVWPKSMRWGNFDIKWIRPIHTILCLFNSDVIRMSFGHITANNKTYYKGKIQNILSFDQYRRILEDSHVYIFQEQRLKIIKNQAQKICDAHNIKMIKDEALLKEVANLVESPHVAIGKIEKRFMKLPREILVSMLKCHQKYLLTEDSEGRLTPYFIIVSNVMTSDQLKTVVDGNEKVLRARLADAEYFYNKDLETTLVSKFKKLKNITLHHKIGSYYDTMQNVKAVAFSISNQLKINNNSKIELISKLMKSDLVTEIVIELPELQGVAGYYYALNDGEDIDVANAIKEHYLPQGPSDPVPSGIFSIIMTLSDKIVLLNSMFAINMRPTGSKDPYALRRTAIGIIRIICSNQLDIYLKELLNNDVIKFIQERIKTLANSKTNIYSIDLKYIKRALAAVPL